MLSGAGKPQLELPAFIEIDEDYILTSHMGDWETLYNAYTFSAEQQSWNLMTENPLVFN